MAARASPEPSLARCTVRLSSPMAWSNARHRERDCKPKLGHDQAVMPDGPSRPSSGQEYKIVADYGSPVSHLVVVQRLHVYAEEIVTLARRIHRRRQREL